MGANPQIPSPSISPNPSHASPKSNGGGIKTKKANALPGLEHLSASDLTGLLSAEPWEGHLNVFDIERILERLKSRKSR